MKGSKCGFYTLAIPYPKLCQCMEGLYCHERTTCRNLRHPTQPTRRPGGNGSRNQIFSRHGTTPEFYRHKTTTMEKPSTKTTTEPTTVTTTTVTTTTQSDCQKVKETGMCTETMAIIAGSTDPALENLYKKFCAC